MPRRRRSEEEEEEEDEQPAKRWVSKLIDFEAEEADSGEEEDDYADADDDDFIDKGNDIPEEYDGGERVRPSPMVVSRDEEEDIEAMEKMVNERYGSRMSYVEDCGEEFTEVDQQALLPSVRDPKLWMVKCLPGHERKVTASLVQKSLDKGFDLQIVSAIALDHLKGYIYVEAYREAHVREACKGMRNIFARNITMVPTKEMSNVLSLGSPEVNISRGDWVRLKRSNYKGELGKVVDVDDVWHKVTVKVTPRAGSLSLSDRLEGADSFYKTVSLSSVSTGDIKPSVEELENFREIGETDADLAPLFERKDEGCWMRNDLVVVVKGDLKNMKGSVEYVEGDIIHIKPNEKIPLKTVAVRKRDLAKYFEPGSHVKVVSGVREGITGMVVNVDQNKLVILSDTSKDQITVFAGEVVESKETSNTHCTTKFSTSRNSPHSASSTNSLPPRCGPPIPMGPVHSGRRHDPVIGTKVKIMRGPYRGYRGSVKGINGQNVRVELEAQMKVITVDRSHLTDNVDVASNMTPRRTGKETPSYPQTPLHSMGGQTPWRSPLRTPSHAHPSTPIPYSAATSAWDQWNPYSLTSPSWLVSTP